MLRGRWHKWVGRTGHAIQSRNVARNECVHRGAVGGMACPNLWRLASIVRLRVSHKFKLIFIIHNDEWKLFI